MRSAHSAHMHTARLDRTSISVISIITLLILPTRAVAQDRPPLLTEPIVAALANSLSGERAHETIRFLSQNHRVRGSRPFKAAANYIAARAREAGLDDVRIEEFPADGKIFYGTQRSRPPWDAEFAELWEMRKNGAKWEPMRLLTSWAKQPMSVAEDSESGDVLAEVVDVGAGTAESDYAGKNVKGKLILVSSQADAVVPLGVERHGAAGIISSAQNQKTAWWGENVDLVRWGHLDSFAKTKTFALMVSPRMAKSFKDRIARGEHVTLHAVVRAGQHPGSYNVVTAAIKGADEQLAKEEIIFSCHLDHPNPGANDNASGCATILEVAVTLQKLINEKRIPRPARTIRFVWPPEVEGTMAILNSKPEWRIKAVVHMDMVGGGPETKSVFHVSSGPASLPSFVYDIGQAFGAFVNEQTYKYAATGSAKYPLISKKGGKEPLLAQLDEFDMGSDHEVYSDASWSIPALYLHDWPDRYIHTTWDTPEKIDPTKLLRAGFIGAASGYFLATASVADTSDVNHAIAAGELRRASRMTQRLDGLSTEESTNLRDFQRTYGIGVKYSFEKFRTKEKVFVEMDPPSKDPIFVRNPKVAGPMSVFGYNYLTGKLGSAKTSKLRLLEFEGLRGSGGDYAYMVRNLLDGSTVAAVRNRVSAIYGPVPLDIVLEYVEALAEAGVVRRDN